MSRGIWAITATEFKTYPHFMRLFWDYLDEYCFEYDPKIASERLLSQMGAIIIHEDDRICGFALYINDKNPNPKIKDFMIAVMYVVPEFRGIKFLNWFKGHLLGLLKLLDYDRWTICIPDDNARLYNTWRWFGFEDDGASDGHIFLAMEVP